MEDGQYSGGEQLPTEQELAASSRWLNGGTLT
ncbi:MAG: hypothetical protein M3N10_09110 [Actinomycetota bacterium]|nr:hypothetical protein [Actinomycetota bacterium]